MLGRYSTKAALCLFLTALQTGCAGANRTPAAIPPKLLEPIALAPLTEDLRDQFGRIGVALSPNAVQDYFQKPANKEQGAARGAATGASSVIDEGMREGARTLNPLYPIAGILFSPFGAMVGGTVGTIRGVSEGELESATAALDTALVDVRRDSVIRDIVLQIAPDQTGRDFVALDDRWGSPPGKGIGQESPWPPRVDTVLEIGTPVVRLTGERDINPPLELVVSVAGRVLRARDRKEIYSQTWTHVEGIHLFTDWAENDARIFREKLERAFDNLAEQVVETIFLLHIPEVAGLAVDKVSPGLNQDGTIS